MAKPELGTKRLCGSCGAKFYDLNKSPIACPKCGAAFVVTAAPTRSRPDAAASAAAARPVADENMVPEAADAEFVSLEEADAENQGTKKKGPAEAAVGEDDEDVELDDESLDDAAFIEEEDEENDDVTDIIGDVDNEEES